MDEWQLDKQTNDGEGTTMSKLAHSFDREMRDSIFSYLDEKDKLWDQGKKFMHSNFINDIVFKPISIFYFL